MKIQFSENIWEQITSLWNDKKRDTDLNVVDEQVKEMMRIYFVCRRFVVAGKKKMYNEDRAWKNIEIRTRERGYRKIRSLLKYVAVFVVGIFGIAFLLDYLFELKMQMSKEQIEVIASGNQKAELILANGKKIFLDSVMNTETATLSEMKFVNSIERGKLSYQGDTVNKEFGFHTLNVPQGGEYILQLPDGSCVWLNSESSIRFPMHFADDKRVVFLSGEAYFEVAKNEKSPFQVHVREGIVTVLGTSFNVSAYVDDEFWETTLVEGKVVVENAEEKVEINPSEQYTIDKKTGNGVLKKVDTYLYTSWIDGKFYFSAYAFEDIVKKLERWYDFTMNYQDEGIKSMRFSGAINKHKPLSDILSFLEKTTNICFEVSGKNVSVKKIKKDKS